MDEPSAHHLVHDGAVYLHQGETYLVSQLDLADRAALVECQDPGYITRARDVADIKVINAHRNASWGDARVGFGDVRVARQVVSFARISPEEAYSAFRGPEVPLSLPPRELTTRAFWLAIPNAIPHDAFARSAPPMAAYAAAHAVEHAAIGLLPLFAACDQRDVAGTSVVEPTGEIRVYVYDAQEGGAGFAERGFDAAQEWLAATRAAIESCPCEGGCPSCVQSPRCGTGNSPLSKADAVTLLGDLLAGTP
jgi:DEAD/DEAH box helicase domain-containing protein